jgi:hypothetical protein
VSCWDGNAMRNQLGKLLTVARWLLFSRRVKIPVLSVEILSAWFRAHIEKPYPNADEKRQLMMEAEVDDKQLINCQCWKQDPRVRFLSACGAF